LLRLLPNNRTYFKLSEKFNEEEELQYLKGMNNKNIDIKDKWFFYYLTFLERVVNVVSSLSRTDGKGVWEKLSTSDILILSQFGKDLIFLGIYWTSVAWCSQGKCIS
jgi:hypothetical protein